MPTKKTTLYICTAQDAVRSYDVTGIGDTPEEALRRCKAGVRKIRKQFGATPWPKEYFDDLYVQPLVAGTTVLDMGAGGEVR